LLQMDNADKIRDGGLDRAAIQGVEALADELVDRFDQGRTLVSFVFECSFGCHFRPKANMAARGPGGLNESSD